MFQLTVSDVFHIHGRGVVVTGAVELGEVRVGDVVQINGGEQVRVDGVEQERNLVDQAGVGASVGLLLSKIDESAVKRGDVISAI